MNVPFLKTAARVPSCIVASFPCGLGHVALRNNLSFESRLNFKQFVPYFRYSGNGHEWPQDHIVSDLCVPNKLFTDDSPPPPLPSSTLPVPCLPKRQPVYEDTLLVFREAATYAGFHRSLLLFHKIVIGSTKQLRKLKCHLCLWSDVVMLWCTKFNILYGFVFRSTDQRGSVRKTAMHGTLMPSSPSLLVQG